MPEPTPAQKAQMMEAEKESWTWAYVLAAIIILIILIAIIYWLFCGCGTSACGPSSGKCYKPKNGCPGATGATGAAGASGVLGIAQYLSDTTQTAIAVGAPFLADQEVINSVPTAIVPSVSGAGTVYTLTTGTYRIDAEGLFTAATPFAVTVGLYRGATAGTLAVDPNFVAGSLQPAATTASWVHGVFYVTVTDATEVFAISPVNAALTTAALAGATPMVRVSFEKYT